MALMIIPIFTNYLYLRNSKKTNCKCQEKNRISEYFFNLNVVIIDINF